MGLAYTKHLNIVKYEIYGVGNVNLPVRESSIDPGGIRYIIP